MSSDPFDLLELDRATATDADVRRAYAAKLKVTRPEDDRAGFMALRAAFEQARHEVRWRDEYGDDANAGEEENDGVNPEAAAFPVGAVAIGDVPLAVIAERARDALSQTKPAHAGTGPYEEDEPSDTENAHDEDAGKSYDDDGFTPEEIAASQPIRTALDRLVDTLTATGRAPEVRDVMAIIDGTDVAGIEEYQSMQWQVRQFLCDRTGYNLEPQELRIPDWLTLEVFDALDQYYGWTRQPATRIWVRRLNDWMARVRRQAALGEMPPEARRRAVVEESKAAAPQDKGSQIWLWIGAGILISQIVRFIGSAGGGG
ncbi:hypothetical protein [Hyphomonas sp.]|jgi:hypothetical protein|uniref:hypothetical protein n=1 Tax=Hyphomonas sp. TaxID=87 RepID=UPI0037BEF5AD